MRGSPVKVLYVLGFGRSGSTVLDLVLGEQEGFFSAGELQSLWQESLLDGRLCGCGSPVGECPVWNEILGGAQCPHLGLTPEAVAALQTEELHIPALGPRFQPLGRSEAGWRLYRDVLGRLYRRIANVSGARVVVDSSKVPSVDRALSRLPDVDLYYLHLVRDPRAVAFSWMRTKRATDRTHGDDMERLTAPRAAATWITRQLAAERVCARVGPERALRLRYEDFVAAPAASVRRVAHLVGEGGVDGDPGDGSDAAFLAGTTAHLSCNHTVSGNPVRLQRGPIELREDAEWKTGLPPAARRTVTLMCWPLLRRYGYV